MIPTLSLKIQFKTLRSKVVDGITKVMRTHFMCQQAAIYCNVCMLANAYFRHGIIKLIDNKEKEFRRLCEALLLSKLRFSVIFPRDVMHVSKEMLGLGLFFLQR